MVVMMAVSWAAVLIPGRAGDVVEGGSLVVFFLALACMLLAPTVRPVRMYLGGWPLLPPRLDERERLIAMHADQRTLFSLAVALTVALVIAVAVDRHNLALLYVLVFALFASVYGPYAWRWYLSRKM